MLWERKGELNLVSLAMRQLVTTVVTLPLSEATCETMGSMMEKYHTNQYFRSSGNEDESCQASLNAKYNGPAVARSHGFIQRLLPYCRVSKFFYQE